MAGKRLNAMDLRTLLRYIRADKSNRAVASDTGVDRRTVGRYRTWAEEHNLLDQTVPLPPLEEFAACFLQVKKGSGALLVKKRVTAGKSLPFQLSKLPASHRFTQNAPEPYLYYNKQRYLLAHFAPVQSR